MDPPLEVRVTLNQIDDLIEEIDKRVKNDDKVLVTTITKRMAEELSKYFDRVGGAQPLHPFGRRYARTHPDPRRICGPGIFDVLVGVNLLREGLDLPEVALVAILDADKEGFLRNVRSLTQIAGRAARHSQGNVILLRRYLHRIDALRHRAEQPPPGEAGALQHGARNSAARKAQKSGSGQSALLAGRGEGGEESVPVALPRGQGPLRTAAAADVRGSYTAGGDLDALIAKAREDTERAAQVAGFPGAAKFRDRMLNFEKLREKTADNPPRQSACNLRRMPAAQTIPFSAEATTAAAAGKVKYLAARKL